MFIKCRLSYLTASPKESKMQEISMSIKHAIMPELIKKEVQGSAI